MDEDRFNMELRKFLKEVGVTSQREIERVVREGAGQGRRLRLHMVLTSPDAPSLHHVVEHTIELS
jgi:16S rRNA U516 pseudouridylate synthase RsuA-like enzyme